MKPLGPRIFFWMKQKLNMISYISTDVSTELNNIQLSASNTLGRTVKYQPFFVWKKEKDIFTSPNSEL